MIHLSFSLPEPASPWHETWDDARRGDPSGISEGDLRYRYFGVNVEMIVDSVEIISKRRFVTLVDLALSLRGVAERISRGEDAAFDFTESEEIISFRRAGDSISVGSSRRPGRGSVAPGELLEKISEFLKSAHSRLVEEIPGLDENVTVRRIASGFLI
ncbi:hypothetical protein [Kitasatospora sp. NPDC093558]|uniref:hypothetical protein n=1 Tax=Kitasatospora sp. NPDC093558 TaxID=3155201 RepID=UPI00344973FD